MSERKSLTPDFFRRDALTVARDLLGCVLWHRPLAERWLAAIIIETEAYERTEKGSHASLGWTEKRNPLFQEPGTVYMYYARGGDSFNVSCGQPGDAVLIKAGYPYPHVPRYDEMIRVMQANNPLRGSPRPPHRLCAGQTLLCKSLGIRVADWNGKRLPDPHLKITECEFPPANIYRTPRLGIPPGRDEELPWRFVHADYHRFCTRPVPAKNRTGATLPREDQRTLRVDDLPLTWEAIRSSGPGGQHVNKVATGVQLRVRLKDLPLAAECLERLKKLAGSRLTRSGDLVLESTRFRSQLRNKEDALRRFQKLLEQAQIRPRIRIPTAPSPAQKEKRIQQKKRQGRKKAERRAAKRPPFES